MQQIIEYKIAQERSNVTLRIYINKMILEGWQPIGGVSCNPNDPEPYMQALVKYKKEAQ